MQVPRRDGLANPGYPAGHEHLPRFRRPGMIRAAVSAHRDRFLEEGRADYPTDTERDVGGLVDAAIATASTDAPACRVLAAMLGAPGLSVDATALHAVTGGPIGLLLVGDLLLRTANGLVTLTTKPAGGSWRVTVGPMQWPGGTVLGGGASISTVQAMNWSTGERLPGTGYQCKDRRRPTTKA